MFSFFLIPWTTN